MTKIYSELRRVLRSELRRMIVFNPVDEEYKDYALLGGGGGRKWCVEHLCYIYTMLITIGSFLIDIYNLVFSYHITAQTCMSTI